MKIQLLPRDSEHGWTPYVWLMYLVLYAGYPFVARVHGLPLLLHLAGLVAFLVVYFRGYWVDGARRLPVIAALVVLGVGLSFVNPGAWMFFVYASAFVGGSRTGSAAGIWIGGITLIGVATAAGVIVSTNLVGDWFAVALLGCVALMTPVIGFVNVHYSETRRRDAALKLAQSEIARLATLAERDRIAGDLHDLLGHTLSVIVLKAELASKLMSRDTAAAATHIAEVERVSREALAEVRRAVYNFGSSMLSDELVRARGVLETAGIALECSADLVPATGSVPGLSPRIEHTAALILRESITNVIRHSQATVCSIAVTRSAGMLHVHVRDDGRAGAIVEGSGLHGMRARAREVGGTLALQSGRGLTVHVTAPFAAMAGTEAAS
jgi:two-component system sensor histidine kinase DesK